MDETAFDLDMKKNEQKSDSLHLAAGGGDIEAVQLLLERGANADAKDEDHSTPLHLAASNGHKEVVKLLLEHDATVNAIDHWKCVPLSRAAENGHKEVVQLLLEHGATVDAKDGESSTSLHRTAYKGHKEVVQLLLEHGAAVDSKNNTLSTPLNKAVLKGHKEVTQLLLEHGATVDAKDIALSTSLHEAAFRGHIEVVQLLLEHGATVNAKDNWIRAPLSQAARNGHKEVVQLLLKHGATVNSKDDNKDTALNLAAISGHKEVVKILLDHDACVDIKTQDSRSAIQLAAANGQKEVVQMLLDHVTTFDAEDSRSNGLYDALIRGYSEIASQLLDRGANVDAKSKDGKTLLVELSEIGDVQMVRLLLDHDADIEALDNDGQTPFLIAAKSSHLEVLSLLISKGANKEAAGRDSLTALHWSAKHDNLVVLDFLLKNGVNIEATTVHGDTALHLAASFNCFNALTVLLDHGAIVGAKNKGGNSPIQSAILQGHIDIVYRLKDSEAAIGRDNDNNSSVLYLAVDAGQFNLVKRVLDDLSNTDERTYHLNATLRRATQLGKTDLVLQLLDMEADIEACGDDGLSSIFLVGHHSELISMFIDHKASLEARNKKMRNLSVLHHYASQAQIEALRILLNCGCNIHLTDDDDNTVLHYATRHGDCEVVAMLLEHGVDINARNREGETALHIAVEKGFAELTNLLLEWDIDIDAKAYISKITVLHIAIDKQNTELISLLVRRHADVNAKNGDGETPLHLAATSGLTEECTLLIEHGANVHSTDVLWVTPLQAAIISVKPDVVELLLKHGAFLDDHDEFVSTLAIRTLDQTEGYYPERQFVAVFKLLIEAGMENNMLDVLEKAKRRFPELRETFKKGPRQSPSKKPLKFNVSSAPANDPSEKKYLSDAIFEPFNNVFSDKHKGNTPYPNMYVIATPPILIMRTICKVNDSGGISLRETKHRYGYGFPPWKYLQLDGLPNADGNDGQNNSVEIVPLAQKLKLVNTVSINDRAIAVIQSLLTCFNARMSISDGFFMLELERGEERTPPEWASHFDKMKGVIREQGRLIVEIPSKDTPWSIPGWHEDNHPYIRFIDAIYVCRRSPNRLDEDIFSDMLGESEQKLATDLHAILIAGLSILSIAGGSGLVEKLVLAVLGEKLDPIQSASPDVGSNDWQVLNRRRCPCAANGIHRPLSPVAAAKAVGINIWRTQQDEVVTRVWDLDQDKLVDKVVATKVIFVTHRWTDDEKTYQDVINGNRSNDLKISSLSEKLRCIKESLQTHTKYIWIDTICIDKSNLSELDRAIRSMYKWYASCAAVVLDSGTSLKTWCERGWCLQEGAAAGVLRGISKEGKLATIQELATEQSHDLCTLDLHLCYRSGNAAEIIARMDVRTTTHEEDMAYALTGVFSIHLTLAYGEGLSSRERLFHELATKKGDLSFLSFQSTPAMFRNYLPAIGQANYLVAKCREASAPVMVSHFGICFDVELVELSDESLILKKLKGWKSLCFAKGRSMGVDKLIEISESQEHHSPSSSLKFAVVHYIRSIMLLETYGKDLQTGGAGKQIELCYRVQCCQIEEKEFARLFSKDHYNLVRIWLRDKPYGSRTNRISK